jgi:hypothetical protein
LAANAHVALGRGSGGVAGSHRTFTQGPLPFGTVGRPSALSHR